MSGLPDTHLRGYASEDGPRLADKALQVPRTYEGKTEDLRRDPATMIERAFGIGVLVEGFGDGFDGLACSTMIPPCFHRRSGCGPTRGRG